MSSLGTRKLHAGPSTTDCDYLLSGAFPVRSKMLKSVTEKSNILAEIRHLQISPGRNPLRQKHRIMKKLICQESSKFKPVWEEESQKAIYYESNRIYFNDYRKCYTSFGCSGLPELLYNLPRGPVTQNIEDALVCEFNTDKVSTSSEDYRSHLIALSRDNRLSQMDLDTGRTMKKVILSNKYMFRSLAWNSAGNSFFVKANVRSILNTAAPFITFVVFETFPLRLHSNLAITKQVFKKSVVDSFIFQGLLIVLHPGNLVRLFSYDRIVQEHTSKVISLEDTGLDGIPLTVELDAEQHLGGYIDAFVCFHDEYTGKKLNTVELEEPWDDTYDHTLALDLDTLVHIYKDSGTYHCVLYRLDRSMEDGDEEKLPKR